MSSVRVVFAIILIIVLAYFYLEIRRARRKMKAEERVEDAKSEKSVAALEAEAASIEKEAGKMRGKTGRK
ncbi:MAG: hypothetical protein COU47_03950 [Candidatus Niyogibacteria bacterium CG10_big_fil_rev_8_21_14_0_10_46_36]|uniref:Uncharacterized protein n=1 Tax=Candidatus Niyogibacteria bacterium CG10_big_fil_rev_8_21_14_0_10_46_36 TaxID=1974726 RepID=A0A2H0TE36_9BACT|nr:MAG: hypothetical protein COU47_03950 [Candidatus Niyogibacteria bacterium CG10_big_fil_rev_8_21_14_0_10_46_36]